MDKLDRKVFSALVDRLCYLIDESVDLFLNRENNKDYEEQKQYNSEQKKIVSQEIITMYEDSLNVAEAISLFEADLPLDRTLIKT